MESNKRKVRHSCVRCRKTFYDRLDKHILQCEKAIPEVDYINCKICSHKSLTLHSHVKKHKITRQEYEKEYGKSICFNSQILLSIRNSITANKSNYRNKLKRQGKLSELENFNKKISKKVSDNIMSNEKERYRRSELMKHLNEERKEEFRENASRTAKITSARRDIQLQRAERLKKWRDKNPEYVQENTKKLHKAAAEWRKNNPEKYLESIKKSCKYTNSKPQMCLFRIVNSMFPELDFKASQFYRKGDLIRQLDMATNDLGIVIEFDGIFHFKEIYGSDNLEKKKEKDLELNDIIVNKIKGLLIRVSYDQYDEKKKDFNKECLNKIKEVIRESKKGLFKIGDSYGQSSIL